jgi:hypothetical protein
MDHSSSKSIVRQTFITVSCTSQKGEGEFRDESNFKQSYDMIRQLLRLPIIRYCHGLQPWYHMVIIYAFSFSFLLLSHMHETTIP